MSFGDISFSSCVTWGSRSFNPVCIADTNQSNAEENSWEKENQWAWMPQRIGEWKQTTWGTPFKITNQSAAKKNNEANRANIKRTVFVWPLLDPPTLIDERNTDAMHTQFAWVLSQPLFFQLNSSNIIGVAMTTKPDFYYVFRNVLTLKRQANHPLFWSKHGWSFTILWSSDTSYLCWRYFSKKKLPVQIYSYVHYKL